MRYGYATTIVIAAATFAGCIAPTSSTEEEVGRSSAAASVGMSASLTCNGGRCSFTVTNNTPNPASNWQVAIALNGTTLQQGSTGAEVNVINGVPVFSPGIYNGAQQTGYTLSPGATTGAVNFQVTGSGTPTIATVDGMANGASGAGEQAMGTDQIAQAVATGALAIATAYENNKLANTGDNMYAQYDQLIWDAHSYAISGSTIVFDSTAPGAAFVPNAAKAELQFLQNDPSVASYLVDGLQSCFNQTTGNSSSQVFSFRAEVLKGLRAGTTSTGSIVGVMPPTTDTYLPSGYNVNTVVDNFTTSVVKGTNNVVSTMTGTKSPESESDFWFGLLTSTTFSSFQTNALNNTGYTTAANLKKYNPNTGNQNACSPFNGPGGVPNPAFTITLNGQSVLARFQGVGLSSCYQNGCTSSMTIDPVGYNTAGPAYDTNLNLLGPQINPFTYNPKYLYAVLDHSSAAANNPAIPTNPTYDYAIQTANGVQTVGTFSTPVTILGVTHWALTVP
jgi:hypothetical protein